jgi:hypothetical protein
MIFHPRLTHSFSLLCALMWLPVLKFAKKLAKGVVGWARPGEFWPPSTELAGGPHHDQQVLVWRRIVADAIPGSGTAFYSPARRNKRSRGCARAALRGHGISVRQILRKGFGAE